MAWEKKGKYYWQETETKYLICAIRINDIVRYEPWSPTKDFKGFVQHDMHDEPEQAKQFCETHFNSRT